ncbi:MAG: V-type ATP synthase subunit F [Candidatus Omnitrophota bacterium]
MYKLAVICPERLEKGFALAGVQTFASDGAGRTQELLLGLLAQKDIGLVLIPQEHLADFEPEIFKKAELLPLPLVVPVPMSGKPTASPETYVSQIVRRAVGYPIKI